MIRSHFGLEHHPFDTGRQSALLPHQQEIFETVWRPTRATSRSNDASIRRRSTSATSAAGSVLLFTKDAISPIVLPPYCTRAKSGL